MISFPPIAPSTCAYEAGAYASIESDYFSAITYDRLLASKPGGAKLSLSFVNIPDAIAALIQASYTNSLSGFYPLTLPSNIVTSIEDAQLSQSIQTGDHLNWYFSTPPRQVSTVASISTVYVELIGDF